MNNRRLFSVICLLFFVACSRFVNLGDKSVSADSTDGLPEEFAENSSEKDSEDGRNEWNEESDNAGVEADAGDSDNYDEGSVDAQEDADSSTDYSGSDNCDAEAEIDDFDANSDDEDKVFPGSFSNDDCGCGDFPAYFPVCCEGGIVVFNPCFAKCYAELSKGTFCAEYKMEFCKNDDDSDFENNDSDSEDEGFDSENNDAAPPYDDLDEDTEIPDSGEDAELENDEDAEIENDEDQQPENPNICGCYPEDELEIFVCGDSRQLFFVSSCLAECHCDSPEKVEF